MMTADLALAVLIDRTSSYYDANVPAYMTYVERTHVSAPSLGRSQEINRSVSVRVADDFAVMKDLPNGSERTGQAFPIIAYFDPFSAFRLSWYANLKRVDIDLQRGQTFELQTPAPDPTVNVVVPYNSYWAVRYAPDSTDAAQHFLIDPTPRVSGGYYPSEVIEDPQTHLPSRIEMRVDGSDESIALDFKVIDGYWVIDHGIWTATQHFAVFTSKVIADVTFERIAFLTQPPDPRLGGTPVPTSSPTLK
jgi:hypothetical protein